MGKNRVARFTGEGKIQGVALAGNIGNVKSDGAGTIATDIFLLYQAGADGDLVSHVRVMGYATAQNTANTAKVIRLYLSTQAAGVTTSANTHLLDEKLLDPQTLDSTTGQVSPVDFDLPPDGIDMPPNATLLVSVSANLDANTGWKVTAFGGVYTQ